jgi:glycosyltransferase involved in cell wall biosynthesis
MTTYQRPRPLRLALTGYLRQGTADFELIVADDGSGPETAEVVAEFAKRAPFPVHHVWQEDRGHRRTRILNLGIVKTAADYVFFTDSDCIPAPDLLRLHLAERRVGRMLIGGFVRVPREVGERADERWVVDGRYEAFLTPAVRRRLLWQHWKDRWQILIRRRRRPHNRGLNMSLWKGDLMRVNGYDENMTGWGNEDGDLRERLKSVGVWPLCIWHRALVYHLDHPVEPSSLDVSANRAYVRRANIPAFAINGIAKPAEVAQEKSEST